MTTANSESEMPVSAAELYAWHGRPGAFSRLTPPWERAELIHSSGPWAEGTRWTIRTKILGPLKLNWIAEHHSFIQGRQFCDRQIHGPFAEWNHTHRFVPVGDSSRLEDNVEYQLPFGPVSFQMRSMIRRKLEIMFAYRHRVTAEDLRRHQQFQHAPRLTVAITGSRGLIGTQLTSFLTSGGHRVIRFISGSFTRPSFDDGTEWRAWNPKEPLPPGEFDGVDAVINLAGDNIASGRWTTAKKAKLRESRVIPTRHLATAVTRDRVPTFLSGSALGIYGNRGDEVLNEDNTTGTGFLAELAKKWEESAKAEGRVVTLRTGIVLSPQGGALAKQLLPFRLGGGAVLGNGNQFLPWIDLQDIVYTIHHALLTPTLFGPVNLCVPQAVTNREFSRTLARVLNRPLLLTVPGFALRLLFGEMAEEALLASMNAVPAKLLASGFTFAQPTLETSLRTMLGK
ncbi:TIGR01777 family oxidoreductase [soil metagenome]